jgi:type I restriction enzyme, R subunit
MPHPRDWDEAHVSEDPAVELLQTLGYTYVSPEALETERGSLKETILVERLRQAVKRLNPWLSDSNLARAVKAVTNVPATSLIAANEKLYVTLTYGLSVEQDRGNGKKGHTVRFFDPHVRPPHRRGAREARSGDRVRHTSANLGASQGGLPVLY